MTQTGERERLADAEFGRPGADRAASWGYIGFLLALGALGWGVLLAAELFPAIGPTAPAGVGFTAYALFFAIVCASRALAVPFTAGVVMSLDAAFYVAACVCIGSLNAGWMAAVALTLDAGVRWLVRSRRGRERARSRHSRRAVVRAVAYVFYAGGMTGGLLMACGWALGADQTLARATGQPAVLGSVLAVGGCVLGAYYAVQGLRLRILGQPVSDHLRTLALRGVVIEAALLPLGAVMALVYDPRRPIGLALVGATYLVIGFVYNRLARAGAELAQRVSELETLSATARRFTASLQLHELVEAVARETMRAIPRAEILLLAHGASEREGELLVDYYERERDAFERIRVARDEGASGWVMRAKRSLSIPDLADSDLDSGGADAGIRAWMGVPIVIGGVVEGVLAVQSRRPAAFEAHHLRLLESLGAQVAIALQNAQLYRMAMIDGLTGLFVRRYFDARLDEEIRRADRYGGGFSIAIMDIDDFKSVNDTHGHVVGDRVLRGVAQLTRDEMRGVDTAARYGGEEIAMILPRTDMVSAYSLAERIRVAVAERRFSADGAILGVTASLGIAEYPGSGARDAEDLIRRADHALYRAKKTGKNRVELYWSDAEELGRSSVRSA